jgi:hypothetical protein
MANAASRYDYKRLANLELQISHNLPRPSQLRQKLHSFFTTPSLRALAEATTKSSESTSPPVDNIVILPIHPPSRRYHTDLLKFCPLSSLPPRNPISAPSSPSISKPKCQSLRSKIHASISSFEGANEYMAKVLRRYDTLSLPTSSSTCSIKSGTMKKESMSKWSSAWILLPSYDLENLRGILDPQTPIVSSSPVSTSPSTLFQ